jgi:glyceraldehyde 3-phosphate dehydrogenase
MSRTTYRVAINGLGRIGRTLFRVLLGRPGLQIVALNDVAGSPRELAHLLVQDSIYGPLDAAVTARDDTLEVAGQTMRVLAVADPATLPWKELRVDCVVECTGRIRTREALAGHLTAGAARVLLSSPPLDQVDSTIVQGVNDADLRPAHRIVSAASCTTHCLGPPLRFLDETIGIEAAVFNTVHAYTTGQPPLDTLMPDLRRARAAAMNIIPTTSGAIRAVQLVYPALAGRLAGMACRVPVPCCSLVDLAMTMRRSVTVGEVNALLQGQAAGPLAGILEYCEAPLVSQDLRRNPHSCVLDAGLTQVVSDRLLRLILWYDNEWGYAHRLADLVSRWETVEGQRV